jgi:colanic acid/amylovoran biosynthesis glycosyltransferase
MGVGAHVRYLKVFRRARPRAVLAEFGQSGVVVLDACRRMDLPLIVHFHGADISKHEVLRTYADAYRSLFRQARAIVAVSRAMQQRLMSLGAPPEKMHCNPCGVDCGVFSRASPATTGPVFVAVGRFVEKKAPQLTILAFARVHQRHPDARLRMIGDGPLLDACRDLPRGLGVAPAVTFLEAQPHSVIQEEMRNARGFVQHSVEAASGDSEGMPVAILEAGASGLPVVATRHAGIPDAVIEGTTGFLVDEHDVDGDGRSDDQIDRRASRGGATGRGGARTRPGSLLDGTQPRPPLGDHRPVHCRTSADSRQL